MSVTTTTTLSLTTKRVNNTTTTTSSSSSPAFEASAAGASSLQANGHLKPSTMTGNIDNTGTSCSPTTMTSSTNQQPLTVENGGGVFENGMPPSDAAVGKMQTVTNAYGKINSIDDATTTSHTAHILNDLNYCSGTSGDLHSRTSPSQTQQQLQQQQQQQQTRLSDDARTLQLALELSLVGLQDDQNCYFENQQKQQQQQHQHTFALNSQHQQQQQQQHTNSQLQKTEFDVGTLSALSAVIAANHTSHSNLFSSNSASASVSGLLIPTNVLDDRSKKSQNMTECVPVPSSEHVAEIVGRQGCKIKALRAKTNTYIKTPVRGEEPVFVVTGRKEDVNKAKREILSAADHFSLIRATRKPSSVEGNSHNVNLNSGSNAGGVAFVGGNGVNSRGATAGPPSLPGQVTIQVRVPYRVVGLVVGPKGATIKHIQQETQTYIVTPSREKEPIFEVTGLPESVQTARKQIEAHIALRTGNATQSNNNNNSSGNNNNALANLAKANGELSIELPNVHTINTLSQILNDDINSEFLASLYENGICSGLEYCDDAMGVGGHVATAGIAAPPLTPPPPLSFNVVTTTQTATGGYPNGSMICNNRFQLQQQQQQQQAQGVQAISTLISECTTGSMTGGTVSAQQSVVKARHELQAIKHHGHGHVHNASVVVSSSTSNGLTRSCSSASSTTSTNGTNNSSAAGSSSSSNSTNSNSPPELLNIWKNLGGGESLDVDEGIGDSPNIWNLPPTLTSALTAGSHCSPNTSISPTDSLLGEINAVAAAAAAAATTNHQQLQLQRQIATSSGIGINIGKSSATASQLNNSGIILHQDHQMLAGGCGDRNLLPGLRRECFVCNEREVTTALVPCGHNMFCMDCANQICVAMDAICPVCNSIVYHAMRIIA